MTALQEIEYLAWAIAAGIGDLVQWLRAQANAIGDAVLDAIHVWAFDPPRPA